MRALLIRVDFETGERAGGIDPTDKNLHCPGWQSLPEKQGEDVEIRLVQDDRDLSAYEDIPGVVILEGEEEIDAAVSQHIPADFRVTDEVAVYQAIRDDSRFPDTIRPKELPKKYIRELHRKGADGIEKREPKKPAELNETSGRVHQGLPHPKEALDQSGRDLEDGP
jgi:hypothetical protein